MSDDVRARAEARLDEALAERGLADPRPELRDRLRRLRETDPAAFERARRHYDDHTLPLLAEGEPVEAWVDYARTLGELSGEGRLVAVDAGGRAHACGRNVPPGALVLFVPADASAATFAAVTPATPSNAQRATYDLLVRGRVEL